MGPFIHQRHPLRWTLPAFAAVATLLLASCSPTITTTATLRTAAVGTTSTTSVVDIPAGTRGALEVVLLDGRSFVVPPGHFPPLGACRIWYPGTPPGRQPPPEACGNALATAPPDTVVLRR